MFNLAMNMLYMSALANCFMPRRNCCCCSYPMFNNSIFNRMNLMTNPFSFGYNVYNNIFAYQSPMYYPSCVSQQYYSGPYSIYNYPSFGSLTSAYKPALNLNTEISAVKPAAKKTKKTKTKKIKVSTKNKLSELNKLGYSAEIGQKLAQDAAANAEKKSTGCCAQYVKETIERCGLGEYESGHAYECADILRKNSNFKEVKVSGKDLKKLPAGCIIVYPQGDADYSSKYGHIEIAMGNGKAVSDFVNSIKPSDNAIVFIPINA